jgi:hypothetical protein
MDQFDELMGGYSFFRLDVESIIPSKQAYFGIAIQSPKVRT